MHPATSPIFLQQLTLTGLRRFEQLTLENFGRFNLITGPNGSGKSTILEGIYLMATGRSFRSATIRPLVGHHTDQFTIFARTSQHTLGLSKNRGGDTQIRVDGETLATQTSLARILPVQFVDPASADLFFSSGSLVRRQHLDWLLFYAKPPFLKQWQVYQRLLKQRNAALKDPAFYHLVEGYDQLMQEAALQIHLSRQEVFGLWQAAFHYWVRQLYSGSDLPEMTYHPGFDPDSFLSQLKDSNAADRERGFTFYGPHRADIRLRGAMGDIDKTFSRGQKKMLLLSLALAQLAVLRNLGLSCIVLVDDFAAELDTPTQQRLLDALSGLDSQVFLSCLDAGHFQTRFPDFYQQAKVFHVEH